MWRCVTAAAAHPAHLLAGLPPGRAPQRSSPTRAEQRRGTGVPPPAAGRPRPPPAPRLGQAGRRQGHCWACPARCLAAGTCAGMSAAGAWACGVGGQGKGPWLVRSSFWAECDQGGLAAIVRQRVWLPAPAVPLLCCCLEEQNPPGRCLTPYRGLLHRLAARTGPLSTQLTSGARGKTAVGPDAGGLAQGSCLRG